MTKISSQYNQLLSLDVFWKLKVNLNGYASHTGQELVTQVSIGRCFQVIDRHLYSQKDIISERIHVKLLEDGYLCWLDKLEVIENISQVNSWEPTLFDPTDIQNRIRLVMQWIENASKCSNKYLWGGTIGPDFDCSGLVQSAFASQSIWIPRDAYQQEKYCDKLIVNIDEWELLKPGDLLFFGNESKCDHVGIYRGEGTYIHSSGKSYGRDGIAYDHLKLINHNPVSSYYRSRFRCAGRISRCHDGNTLP